MKRYDYRSAEALEWRKLYSLAAWRKGRLTHLATYPTCRFHDERGESAEATVVDHIIEHKGDRDLFLDESNWQSLCGHCHDRLKQQIEARGWHDHAGLDGLPVDPNHPFNRAR